VAGLPQEGAPTTQAEPVAPDPQDLEADLVRLFEQARVLIAAGLLHSGQDLTIIETLPTVEKDGGGWTTGETVVETNVLRRRPPAPFPHERLSGWLEQAKDLAKSMTEDIGTEVALRMPGGSVSFPWADLEGLTRAAFPMLFVGVLSPAYVYLTELANPGEPDLARAQYIAHQVVTVLRQGIFTAVQMIVLGNLDTDQDVIERQGSRLRVLTAVERAQLSEWPLPPRSIVPGRPLTSIIRR
jgi:hypothetical protein